MCVCVRVLACVVCVLERVRVSAWWVLSGVDMFKYMLGSVCVCVCVCICICVYIICICVCV
jgi:hypothetical protein